MKTYALVFLLFFVQLDLASAFCGKSGDRVLHGDLTRAAVYAAEWTRLQLDHNTLGHVFAAASHSLRLVGYPVNKDAVARLKVEIKKAGLSALPTGRIAYYVNAIVSACENPNDFYGHDLIKPLKIDVENYPIPGKFDHPYHYSLALLALCSSNNIDGVSVNYALLDQVTTVHGGDTLALVTMASSCILKTLPDDATTNPLRTNIAGIINKSTAALKNMQKSDGSFGNSITTALAGQALLSADVKPDEWNCAKTMTFLLRSQQNSGSFQNYVKSTIQVMPVLIGAVPHDVKNIKCPVKPPVPDRYPIDVCVRVEFLTSAPNSVTTNPPPSVSLTVLNGTTAYDILKLAAQQHSCYQFTTVSSAYGRSIDSICGVATDKTNKKYWIMFKDANTWAPSGIDTFKPVDGSCVIFKYMQFT